jgi:hypothetical protein
VLAVGLLVSFIAAALALANIRRYLADRRRLELQRTVVLEQEQRRAPRRKKRTGRRRTSCA